MKGSVEQRDSATAPDVTLGPTEQCDSSESAKNFPANSTLHRQDDAPTVTSQSISFGSAWMGTATFADSRSDGLAVETAPASTVEAGAETVMDGRTAAFLSASAANPSSFGTIPQLANYLTDGYWAWSGYQGTGPRHWASGTLSVNITDLTPAEQALAISALNAWHEVSNLNFTLTSGPANITYINDGSQAFSSHIVSGGSITSAIVDISSDWWPNDDIYSYMYQTYLHETGHALGLGHQGPYNNSANYGVDNIFTNDTWQWSVMSYFPQSDFGGGSYDYVITPEMADIYAAQSVYGAATTRTGDTTYGFNSNAGSIFDFTQYIGTPAFTIYDSGGADTLDCVAYTKSLTARLGGDSRIGLGLIQGGERWRFVMPIPLRADFDAPRLRAAARYSKAASQARRLLGAGGRL